MPPGSGDREVGDREAYILSLDLHPGNFYPAGCRKRTRLLGAI